MKKINFSALVLVLSFLFLFQNICSANFVLKYKFLDGNNVRTIIWNSGVFNQDPRTTNTAGFEWPKGTGKKAIFTTGLSLAAYVRGSDGILRLGESMASYKGEWAPGYILNGVATENASMHMYLVKAGDNAQNNPDYADWYIMVPFGAPYKDVNNNGIYDNGIDIPGMPNSAQTIFQVLTDGFAVTHNAGEGFGGGVTNPLLKAEMHMTAWCYNNSDTAILSNTQFLRFDIINKNDSAWRKAYFGIVCDPDIGDGNDDYIGCDTSRKLGFCYNGYNNDMIYGSNPPAIGIQLLKGAYNRGVSPNVDLGMTSFNFFTSPSSNPPVCESDPNGDTLGAYNMLKGLKKDGSPYMNPNITPYAPTKYCYNGNPVTNTGWNEVQGSIKNCGGTTGNLVAPNPVGDRRFIIGSGADNFTVRPNEKQTILISQFVGRSSSKSPNSNLTAITVLKTMSDTVKKYYQNNFPIGVNNISTVIPDKFSLFQNYPNPFNPATSIKYSVQSSQNIKLVVYDILGKEISTLVNEKQSPGIYEVTFDASNYPSGVYFYKLSADNFSEIKKMVLIK